MIVSCGIDFGTSNSAVAASVDGDTEIIDLEHGQPNIPSAIFFDAEKGRVSFGRDAIRNYVEGTEGRLMRALKSILGSSLIEETTYVEGRPLSYKDVLAVFLKHLKSVTETDMNEELTHAVIGRPVFFVDDDPRRDRAAQQTLEDCARSVGFAHVEFELEPIAAALDFEASLDGERITLIVDIGGGTADFSVVRLGPARAKRLSRKEDILATLGVHIGGTDFDHLLAMASVMPLLGYRSAGRDNLQVPGWIYFDLATWHKINVVHSSKVVHEVKGLAHFYADAGVTRTADESAHETPRPSAAGPRRRSQDRRIARRSRGRSDGRSRRRACKRARYAGTREGPRSKMRGDRGDCAARGEPRGHPGSEAADAVLHRRLGSAAGAA